MQVESKDQRTMIVAIRKTLSPRSPLLRSLAKRNLSTMDELLAQANRYANMKEELRVIGNKQKIDGAKSRMAKEEQEDLSTTLK